MSIQPRSRQGGQERTLGTRLHVYFAKFMLIVSHNYNPITYVIYREIKYTKKREQCFESKCYRDKTSKVHNIRYLYKYRRPSCILQQYNATTNHQRAIKSNFMTILDFFISHQSLKKTGRCREAVAVGDGLQWPLQRGLNKRQCMDCLPRQKKCRCREMAVSGGSTVIKPDFPVWLTLLNK